MFHFVNISHAHTLRQSLSVIQIQDGGELAGSKGILWHCFLTEELLLGPLSRGDAPTPLPPSHRPQMSTFWYSKSNIYTEWNEWITLFNHCQLIGTWRHYFYTQLSYIYIKVMTKANYKYKPALCKCRVDRPSDCGRLRWLIFKSSLFISYNSSRSLKIC